MEMLIGRKLVRVQRLSWHQPGEADNLSVGPVHLVFEGGQGIFFAGGSDWSLELVETDPESRVWLDVYDYDWYGSRWLLRDASGEPPFAAVVAQPFVAMEPVRNEVDQVIGVNLNFGGQTLTLQTWGGEVTT
ncbi:hypothetical protein ACIA5C_47660 [Actinoplanes sp. NPDC051343]|uniref:hypothetical protein n=1 Tax=Actinoplanes sp. NPDC051343 TaxID=3363906 RepID=UPI00379DF62D